MPGRMSTAAPAKEIQRRVRTGCLTCRKRKIKCDERKPRCRFCEVSRRDCLFETPAASVLRKEIEAGTQSFKFAPDHVWIETPSQVRFVHQVEAERPTEAPRRQSAPVNDAVTSTDAAPSYQAVTSNDAAPSNATPSPRTPHSNMSSISSIMNPEDSPYSHLPGTPMSADPAQYFRIDHDVVPAHYSTAPSYIGTRGGSLTMDDPTKTVTYKRLGSSIYTRGPPEPLKDPREARLLQHYIDNLASWLDLNDPNRHFATFVPYLALSCPILFHAILAFSASHLSQCDSSFDANTAIEYHDTCVKGLIPALENPSTALDNVLPSSTVILRMHEMLSYETDHQRHLRGCSSLFNHNRTNIEFRALKRTAFWTYVREEILVALPNRSPTNIRTGDWTQNIVWEGDHDYVRTNQITWLAAEVVNFCFGGHARSNSTKWSSLQQEIDHWKRTLPETFLPVYVMHENEIFPVISYLCSWHVIGMQFYFLVKVLLALHNPQQPKGLEFLNYARSTELEILDHTRQLCGMTKTLGKKHPGALVNAVQPLVICGRSLRKRDEQDELIRMLRQIERDTAWSTSSGINALQDAWRIGPSM